ncbi:preprotein translocase subunit YajC [Amycolatopsis rhizosphaerae]|uniref:Preprotein translocase subunit YajC n=1 Tax=Amycolatopsis rhizosphaerae TaxID=2053003 RepID=A0A558C7D3_9PSEU|nr:preprotein translocase subunit YajC [Amycolatopsis rhizosphaerae]TVT44701.1 preprotein translocase subunit YajC [Amycolatopsis rhizosphaerae]
MNQSLPLLLLLMLVLAVPLVLGSRKQKRLAQEQQQLLSNLAEGDRVMTSSGLYGTVADASDETTIDIEIAPGVVTTWLRQAVREKVAPPVDETEDTEDTDEGADAGEAVEASDAADTATAADGTEAGPAAAGSEDEKKSESQVAPSLEHGKK